jgi:SanA protein
VGSIEVDVMSDYSVELGISEDNLIADREGFRTLETCQRAVEDFGVQDALLVTQAFHLPRALYLCDSLGLEVHGVQADRRAYSPLSLITWTVRESVATAYAWFEVTTGL